MAFVNPLNMLDPMYLMGVLAERQDFGNERPKYIGERLFPRKNFPESTVAWETVRKENRLAGIYSARGKAVPGDDISFKTYFDKVIWLKAGKVLDTDTVQLIRDPGMINVYKEGQSAFAIQGIADRVTAKMTEYTNFVDDQLAAQEEYLATQALQGSFQWPPLGETGLPITTPMPEWNAEGGKMSLVFPFYSRFKQNIWELDGVPASPGMANRTGTGYNWLDKVNADPRYDFEVIADMMLELKSVDVDGATVLMSRKALSYIAMMEKIQRWLTGTSYNENAVNYADLNNVKTKIMTTFGFTIELYDAKWSYIDYDNPNADGSENIKSVRFIPANKMIVLPGKTVGVMAQAPHETQSGDFVHGKTMYVKREDTEPYTREVGISNKCWPLITDPEGIGIFTLW